MVRPYNFVLDYGRHGAYDQFGNGPYWSEEHRSEMEEIREEPEEEREGPFNLFGLFRGGG